MGELDGIRIISECFFKDAQSLSLEQQAVKDDVNLELPAALSSPRKDSQPENRAMQRQAHERGRE